MDLLSGFWKVSAGVSAKAKTMLNLEGKHEEGGDATTAHDSEVKAETEKPQAEPHVKDGNSSPESEGPDSVKSSPATSPEAAEQTPKVDETGEATGNEAAAGSAMKVKDVSHKAVESAKSIGSFLFAVANKAGRTVSETAKHLKHTVEENSILADFNREQEAFVNSKGASKDAATAPWVGCVDEESVKQEILSLSQDKRNFVRSPPAGVQAPFNFEEMHPVASIMLQEDPKLEKMRFELVPKLINEETFWRNYFYRVSLIKQSTQLSSMTREKSSSGGSSSWSSRKSSSDESTKLEKRQSTHDDDDDLPDSPNHEFASDAYQGSEISAEDLKQGMKQLGVSGGKAAQDDEWEQELQQELQDYEMVPGEGNTEDPEWESEIQEMLGDAAKSSK